MQHKKQTILIMFLLLLLDSCFAASYWVSDPTACPTEDQTNFPGQDCIPKDICGDSSGSAVCYDTSLIGAPSSTTYSNTSYSGSFDGGYILNCYAPIDAAEPYCDNDGAFWCDRDSSCYNVGRETACNKNTWAGDANATDCGYCRGSYIFCDGSYTDADGCEVLPGSTAYPGEPNAHYNASCNPVCNTNYHDCDGDLGSGGNGCEIHDGAACTVGALSGTYNGCSGSKGNCVIAKSNFETGTKAEYNPIDNLLWGIGYADGNLINFMSYDYNTRFWVDIFAGIHTDQNIDTGDAFVRDDLNVAGDSNFFTVSAYKFFGDGSGLTGISGTGGTVTMDVNDSEANWLFSQDLNCGADGSCSAIHYDSEVLPDSTLDNNTTAQAWFWNNLFPDSTLDTNINAQNWFWSSLSAVIPWADVNVADNISVNWAGLQNYPSACSSGQYVHTIGDTLTCSTPSYTADTTCDTNDDCKNWFYQNDSNANTVCDGNTVLTGNGLCQSITDLE